ncbi:hypothetical protein [Streptomyces noursei]|uniref:hypothetical protein n=1 Tax=Streptomyces noursei TaxID=1971 RepID=UPI001674B9F9|nr:hypothetical protein [Streptomyces noursei]MCZ1017579.1 hypothetical protein [Streptomyces noursei]
MPESNGSDNFPYEKILAKTVEEMQKCPDLNVTVAEFGELSPPLDDLDCVFDNMAEHYDLPLSQRIRDRFFRHDEIETYWRSSRPDSALVGEFSLTHVYRSVAEKHLSDIWEGADETERELYGELRIFDDTPHTGSGRMATLRVTPGSTDPEIWFFDMREGPLEMDLDYPAYLDSLILTKGTIGWQYLFCDAGFGDPGFTPIAEGLKEMLDVFPQLFPGHDYSGLQARLQERM